MQQTEARERVRRIVDEYDRLVRDKNDYMTKVRTSLVQQLAIIDQTMKEVPDPSAADRAASEAKSRAESVAAPVAEKAPAAAATASVEAAAAAATATMTEEHHA